MGNWGLSTDACDGAWDLLDALFESAHSKDIITPGTPRYDPKAVKKAAIQLMLETSTRPLLTDTAGAVLVFLKHGHQALVPMLALRLAEVALERELDNWAVGRRAQVLAELRTVRAAIGVRRSRSKRSH
jgi:hypothetical protein